jgi:hypothetical protein
VPRGFPTLVPSSRELVFPTGGFDPAAAVTSAGVVAVASVQNGDVLTLLALQRFAGTGRPLGPLVRISPPDDPTAADPAVTPLVGGGFVTTWSVPLGASLPARAAVFDASGALRARPTVAGDVVTALSTIPLPDGGFALFSARGDVLLETASLAVQRFDARGLPTAAPVVFGAIVGPSGETRIDDAVGVAVAGGLELLWTDPAGLHAGLLGDGGIVRQRLLARGDVDGVDVDRLADGRVVATWARIDTAGAHVFETVFDAARLAAGGPAPRVFTVGAADDDPGAANPEVVALPGGGFAISWHAGVPEGHTLARTFGPTGVAGPAFRAQGDFVGLDETGRVVSTRADDAGALHLLRYDVLGAAATTTPAVPQPATAPTMPHAVHGDWLL